MFIAISHKTLNLIELSETPIDIAWYVFHNTTDIIVAMMMGVGY